MPNTYFQFKQFRIEQSKSPLKVTTEGCILGAWAQHDSPDRILDIGTGTGLLCLMVAQRYPQARIDAVEIQQDSYEEAKQNLWDSRWRDNLSIYHMAVQDFKPAYRYDLIVSNPPFFAGSLKSSDQQKNAAKHEGSLSQSELLDAINRLISPEGNAVVIYPEAETMNFRELIRSSGFHINHSLTIRNFAVGNVLRVVTRFSRVKTSSRYSQLIIREHGHYTEDFIKLLKDYYLNL